MNNEIVILVEKYISRFLKKMDDYKINIKNIKYLSDDKIECTVSLKEYNKIKKYNYYSNIKIINYLGVNGLKIHLKKYMFEYILFFFCFILMDVLSSYIVKIDIIHENKRIRELVKKELINHNIKKYSLAYSFDELEKIKEDILKDHPNELEWMSITRDGMSYIVHVEERIINKEKKEKDPGNIVSLKDALITKIVFTKGEALVRSGDYVKKGDILISGLIKLYDEVKGYTSASGTVYGNVWYDSEIIVPDSEEINIDTGKKRLNININNKILLKNKYKYFRQENIRELKILGIKIKIYREVEYKKLKKKYSDKELDLLMEKKLKDAFIKKLNNNGKIISQKVLKKIKKDSKIEYRVFVVTNEIVSKFENIEMSDDNDSQKSS